MPTGGKSRHPAVKSCHCHGQRGQLGPARSHCQHRGGSGLVLPARTALAKFTEADIRQKMLRPWDANDSNADMSTSVPTFFRSCIDFYLGILSRQAFLIDGNLEVLAIGIR